VIYRFSLGNYSSPALAQHQIRNHRKEFRLNPMWCHFSVGLVRLPFLFCNKRAKLEIQVQGGLYTASLRA
jgi:hypothetical protein